MEFFDRAKAILFNPKEEWVVIEAENPPHAKVFAGYLLILALIPAIVIFIRIYWAFSFASYGFNASFFESTALKWAIISALTQTVLIIVSAYSAAAIINAFSEQYGRTKDFNQAFALVAYSFTPLCVAGILYIYSPLAFLVPLVGCYGFYLLYLGYESQLKPAADKKIACLIISLIAVVAVWAILSKVVPAITQQIMIESTKNSINSMMR